MVASGAFRVVYDWKVGFRVTFWIVHAAHRFLLAAPCHRDALYPNNKYDSGTRCCDVSMDEPDLVAHPLFRNVDVLCVSSVYTVDW